MHMATHGAPPLVTSMTHDCYKLRDVVKNKGSGTNEEQIIDLLAHRNAHQRKAMREFYTTLFKKDVLKDLEDKLSCDFLRVTKLWMMDPVERDVLLVHESTKGLTNSCPWVIMEVACTRSSRHLFKVRKAYHSKYQRSLEQDVSQNSKGDIRKLLVSLVTAFRYEGKEEVDLNMAISEAEILHETISHKAYNDDEIILILTTRSKAQINATLNQYNNLYGDSISKVNGNDINKDLKADPRNEYLRLLRGTIKCLTYPEKYFEKFLRLALKKLGTDKQALTRVVTTRAEVDLDRIKEEYLQRNHVSLDNAIVAADTSGADTSGDYEKFLLALIEYEDS